jgi:hypothetical protein
VDKGYTETMNVAIRNKLFSSLRYLLAMFKFKYEEDIRVGDTGDFGKYRSVRQQLMLRFRVVC